MKKTVFSVFTFVYLATAVATLVAFLVQARLIRTDLPPGTIIPYLGALITAVLIETVAGYIGLAKNLFGLKTLPENEAEIRKLAITAMKTLNRLQALAYNYSLDIEDILKRFDSFVFRQFLGESNVDMISNGNRLILEATKQIENAITQAEDVLLTGDTKKIKALNNQLESFIPLFEKMLNEKVS
jgi:hypothetical protein